MEQTINKMSRKVDQLHGTMVGENSDHDSATEIIDKEDSYCDTENQ